MRTISAGIAGAEARGLGAVFVAAGMYAVDHADNDFVELVDGVSLYGGFSGTDWSMREPSRFITTIVDLSPSQATSQPDEPHAPVVAPGGVSDATIVTGFRLQAASAGYTAAVSILGGSPTIEGNDLRGGATALDTAGVSVDGGAPIIVDNLIDGVGGPPTRSTRGVVVFSGTPMIVRNDIASGEGDFTEGIRVMQGDPEITHNAVFAARSGRPRGIDLAHTPARVFANTIVVETGTGWAITLNFDHDAPSIQNNNLVVLGAGSGVCISTVSSTPTVMRNNNFGCDAKYDPAVGAFVTTLSEVEALVPGASGNVAEDPGLVDGAGGDLRLRADGSTPCDVARGGLDLGAEIEAVDRDGAARTTTWSIGAYEHDGACL